MDLTTIGQRQDRVNYFKNIALAASKACLKDLNSTELTDEDVKCLQTESLKLHYITNTSVLERWALDKSRRPYEEYYWLGSQ